MSTSPTAQSGRPPESRKVFTLQRLIWVALAGVVALIAYTIGYSSAASLGSIAGEKIGTGTSVIASCDPDGMTVNWGNYSVPTGGTGYAFNQVLLSGVSSACNGAAFSVTISDATNAALNTTEGPNLVVSANQATITLTGSGSPVSMSQAKKVALILIGP